MKTTQPISGRLLKAFSAVLPEECTSGLELVLSDWDEKGDFGRFAGLYRLRDELINDALGGRKTQPILALGLSPPPAFQNNRNLGINVLWQWPGFAYLPFGFNMEELRALAHQVMEGANSPLPPALFPSRSDLSRRVSEVRHWLQNRLRNIHGTMICVESAATGEEVLNPFHLEPVLAISSEHAEMLERLWACELPARSYAPISGGLDALKISIRKFESRWQSLEQARAHLRAQSTISIEVSGSLLSPLRAVIAALESAIEATREFDQAMDDNENE